MSSASRRTHFVYNLGSGNSAGTRFNDFTTICVPRGHTVRVLLFAVRQPHLHRASRATLRHAYNCNALCVTASVNETQYHLSKCDSKPQNRAIKKTLVFQPHKAQKFNFKVSAVVPAVRKAAVFVRCLVVA